MLILVAGPRSSGRRSVADFLVERHGFSLALIGIEGQLHSVFASVGDLDEFLLTDGRWQENWVAVLPPSITVAELDAVRKRPYVLLLVVDAAPTDMLARAGPTADNEGALATASLVRYRQIQAAADIVVFNDAPSIHALHAALARADLVDLERLRPSWDTYFLALCHLASLRSNCMKRRVGALLVSSATRRVLSTGYNGTPRGLVNCGHGGCARCNSGAHAGVSLDTCLCLHAEENALLEVGRAAFGATLYCTTFPCLGCAKKIVQCGVAEVVYAHGYDRSPTGGDLRVVDELFGRAGVSVRQHNGGSGVGRGCTFIVASEAA
ncbi:cytidine deaminase-like protein [Blastocladiella britannica]|nr:cytidine deaminase-like protein [Blastocladiella britannica]